jgi:hypothetical protein
MTPIQVANQNKYHTGAYEIFGYNTRDDVFYKLFRNCVKSMLEGREKGKKLHSETSFKTAIAVNAFTGAGYVPGIGLITGIILVSSLRSQEVALDPKSHKEKRVAALAKGIVQMVGLGILFLPIDLWVTIQRRRNPPEFTNLLMETQEIKSGQEPDVDYLRNRTAWVHSENGIRHQVCMTPL